MKGYEKGTTGIKNRAERNPPQNYFCLIVSLTVPNQLLILSLTHDEKQAIENISDRQRRQTRWQNGSELRRPPSGVASAAGGTAGAGTGPGPRR